MVLAGGGQFSSPARNPKCGPNTRDDLPCRDLPCSSPAVRRRAPRPSAPARRSRPHSRPTTAIAEHGSGGVGAVAGYVFVSRPGAGRRARGAYRSVALGEASTVVCAPCRCGRHVPPRRRRRRREGYYRVSRPGRGRDISATAGPAGRCRISRDSPDFTRQNGIGYAFVARVRGRLCRFLISRTTWFEKCPGFSMKFARCHGSTWPNTPFSR